MIGPHLIKNSGYDPLKDFDYITVAVQAPNVLAVPANSPHKTLADVIAYEKANPGKMSFASAGNGTSDHLTAELFWQETGTKGLHIPYKGGAPAMTDLLGGQVDATFMNINTGLPNIKAGKLRALAITSAKRSPLLPDVPTMEELGVKGVTVYSWQAFAAPKGLPADIKAKLHDAIVAGLNDPQRQAQAARTRLRDRRQHAGAVHRLPGRRVRALEEGDRGRQDHRGLSDRSAEGARTMAETAPREPLYITMHERDNVAIVANDGGLPAGTSFAVGPDAGRQGAAGPQGRAGRPGGGRRGAALQRGHRPRGAGHPGRQLGARAAARDARGALARRPADRDRQARAAGAARGLHLRGLPQRRRLGRHPQHPGDHDDGAVRRRRRRLRGQAHQGRAAAEVPERRRRGRPASTPTAAASRSTRRTRRSRSAPCATSR